MRRRIRSREKERGRGEEMERKKKQRNVCKCVINVSPNKYDLYDYTNRKWRLNISGTDIQREKKGEGE